MRHEIEMEKTRKALLEALPPIFGRAALEKLLPGIVKKKTLENAGWRGDGPGFVKIGRRCVYQRESFVEWLLARMTAGGRDCEKNKM